MTRADADARKACLHKATALRPDWDYDWHTGHMCRCRTKSAVAVAAIGIKTIALYSCSRDPSVMCLPPPPPKRNVSRSPSLPVSPEFAMAL